MSRANIGPHARKAIDAAKNGASVDLLDLYGRAEREAARAPLTDHETFAIADELRLLVLARMKRPCDCYGCAHGNDCEGDL